MPLRVQAYLQQRIGDETAAAGNERALQRQRERIVSRNCEPLGFARMRRAKANTQHVERHRHSSLDLYVERLAHNREHPETIRRQHVMEQRAQ